MNSPAKPARAQWLGFLIMAVLLGTMVWVGGADLIEVIERGVIRNRRGPDLTVARSPVLFWGAVAFFGAGLTLCLGLAAACLSIVVNAFIGPKAARAEAND